MVLFVCDPMWLHNIQTHPHAVFFASHTKSLNLSVAESSLQFLTTTTAIKSFLRFVFSNNCGGIYGEAIRPT